jgi:hypothetical protein
LGEEMEEMEEIEEMEEKQIYRRIEYGTIR